MLFTFLIFAGSFCLQAFAHPMKLQSRDFPVHPSDDSFYTPPPGYESEALGTILRIRKKNNPYGVITFQANVEAVFQVLVRSEDTFKQPIAVMSTLFIPHNANSSRLLSYQVAENSPSIDCSPSYAMQLFSNVVTYIPSQLELLLIISALDKGWNVLVPDHEGPRSTIVAGWLAGYAVLNSIKGALQTGGNTGIDLNAEVAIWGYSGGSVPSGWAAQLQPSYYPELNLKGAAYGGILADIKNTLLKNMGTPFSGLVVAAINALSHEYPLLKLLVKEKVYIGKYAKFTRALKMCVAEYVIYYFGASWTDYFAEGAAIMEHPIMLNITDHNNMRASGLLPTCPIFFYASQNDELVPISDTYALYDHFCDLGVSVTMNTDYISEHITTAVLGASLAFDFLHERFNGVSAPATCSQQTAVTNLQEPGALAGLGRIAVVVLELLSKPAFPGELI
jgi:pimeloyl-ACP methyl ester carboxylesterase